MGKELSLNILEIAKKIKKLEQSGSGGAASDIIYDNSISGLNATKVQGAIDEVVSNVDVLETELSEKISTDEGTFEDGESNTYTGVTVDMLSYDETNNQLLMKVDGADTVIPFNHGGTSQVATGTFTTASEQYGIANVNCGFEPDLIIIILPFQNGDTTSYWWREASWSTASAIWCVQPAENSSNVVALGRTTGETGIQAINSNGFAFMCNGANTRNVTCKYLALKY